jgi:predicted RNA binding protein YcfA (HicA-like mRNA interferase family)
MSKAQKLVARLAAIPPPKDFTWDELCVVLAHNGFVQDKKSGSGVLFYHPIHPERVIHLHRPHGNPPVVLICYIRNVVQRMKEWGLI